MGFSNIHSDAKQQKKLKGDPLGKQFFLEKKSRSAQKNEKGDPLVSPGMVCYAEKQEKPFWISSRGLKKKKSHYNSRVSLHEAPTKNSYFYLIESLLLVSVSYVFVVRKCVEFL